MCQPLSRSTVADNVHRISELYRFLYESEVAGQRRSRGQAFGRRDRMSIGYVELIYLRLRRLHGHRLVGCTCASERGSRAARLLRPIACSKDG